MVERFLGRLLRGVQAGEPRLVWHHPAVASAPDSLVLTSPAFDAGAPIPPRHAYPGMGENVSPPLAWSGGPEGTQELVLLLEDAVAPLPRPFVHCLATGLAPSLRALPEAALSARAAEFGITLGRCTLGLTGYNGPRGIAGHGVHRYTFQLLALGRRTAWRGRPTRAALLRAIAGSVLARGRLDGLFERP